MAYLIDRPRGRSELRDQDDDHLGRAARRLGRGHAEPGHRPDREEARRPRPSSTSPARSRGRAGRSSMSTCCRRPGPRDLPRIWQRVRNMMADIRPDFPAEFAGFSVQRRFRRRVRQSLCLHRRRLHPARAARLCRDSAARGPGAARCRQGRDLRHPRRGRLSGVLDHQARGAGAEPAGRCTATLAAQNAILPSGDHRRRARAGAGTGRRPVFGRAKPRAMSTCGSATGSFG